MADTEWTDNLIATLTRLWNQTDPKLSTRAIADQMRMTKGAIVGKAHRLELTCRTSPIRHSGEPAPPRSPAPPPPPLPCLVAPPPALPPVAAGPPQPNPTPEPECQPAPRYVEPNLVPHASPPRTRCCWPMWRSDQRPTHVYCGKARAPNPPAPAPPRLYCVGHNTLAYAKAGYRPLMPKPTTTTITGTAWV